MFKGRGRDKMSERKSVEKVCIIGSGTMGRALSITFARAGVPVVLLQMRRNKDALEVIKNTLQKELKRGKISEAQYASALENTTVIKDPAMAKNCTFVIETVIEDFDIKVRTVKDVLLHIADREGAVIATNTSSLDVEALAEKTGFVENTIGLHFFNPPYRIPFVEITLLESTGEDIKSRVASLMEQIGMQPLYVKNTPGFIVNRLLFTYLNEAYRLVDEEGYSMEDVDFAMVKATGHPMGPFLLSDYIGLDVCLEILETLYEETGHDVRYAPPEVLKDLVRQGFLGKKTGRGFYEYGKR